jgi:hypothetical protein
MRVHDRERLKPGGNWHNDLREVQGRCALFVSLISQLPSVRSPDIFIKNATAADWQPMYSEGEEFYVPVVIDDSSIPARREPRIFRNIQVTLLPGGEVTPEFGQHMRALQEKHRATAPLQ